MTPRRLLIVIGGATASGKTALAVGAARALGCDIISADSRQIYRGMEIGTAAPTAAERAAVRHHLVGELDPADYYSASRFEADALRLLDEQWRRGPYAVVCGGSMMYVDALTDGLDELPTVSQATRERVLRLADEHGAEGLLAYLDCLDPATAATVDRANLRRVMHAIEISIEAGRPYSELIGRGRRERPFDILKVAIERTRDELFDRINRRVEAMMAAGLPDEARRLYPLRHLNALNTVGYKEMFAWLDGVLDLATATARIAKNTRVYAKKQLTWLRRPGARPTAWLPADGALDALMELVAARRDSGL